MYKIIRPKSKNNVLKSNTHKEFDKCEHIVLFLNDFDMNDVDEAFYLYIIEHIKRIEYYLIASQFKLVFNIYQHFP